MPVSPKSNVKKTGAPKGKGAVRAKSGCYTCRIRRKKCDEKPNEDNHCETCVRLRLECLGFGTKRPEWLRDNRNVLAVRDRIKTHLAAQGMIKGHSGAGPRNAEREPPVLRLHEDYPNSASSQSPPTPTLSISSTDEHRRSGLHISSMRDDSHYHPPLQTSLEPYHSGLTPRIQELSPNSPVQPSRGPIYANDIMLPPYSMSSSASIDSPPAWQSQTSYPPSECPSRAVTSSFSTTYHTNYDFDDAFMGNNTNLVIHNPLQLESISHGISEYAPYVAIPYGNAELVEHYLKHVVDIQYLLADTSIRDLILENMQRSPSALDAVCMLSSLHKHALNVGAPSVEPETDRRFKQVSRALVAKPQLDEGDAMAGLHLVSYVLFSGGRGKWQEFLQVACRYSDSVLFHPQYQGPQDALMRCSTTTRFIIKTSMWFDVLASATRVEIPYFYDLYHNLFSPETARIEDPSTDLPEQLSMLSVMGCENHIVWALAEISNLACWKEAQKRHGALSMVDLVRRGSHIEQFLMPGKDTASRVANYFDPDEKHENRILTSEVFRASARVYLHSVLSGDYPSCREIADGVQDTIRCLERVPERGSRSVVRSVVFSICICGCLTDIPWQREFLLERLDAQGTRESVGNCIEVKKLMSKVWENRAMHNYDSLTWRDVMRSTEMLLV